MASTSVGNMVEVPLWDEDRSSVEYKLLMDFAQLTLPASRFEHLQKQEDGLQGQMGSSESGHTATSDEKEAEFQSPPAKEGKKKGHWRRRLTPRCLRPEKEVRKEPSGMGKGDKDAKRAATIARRLQEIAQNATAQSGFRSFRRSLSLEVDGEDEDKLIQDIAGFLRQAGDKLDEEMQQNPSLLQALRSKLSYSFFSKVMGLFLSETVPGTEPESSTEPGPDELACRVALSVQATTQLTAIDNHPMNQVLGFGVKYLKEHFSPWIQSQGGWEKAMGIQEDEEVE
ncbi:apoptosis facilitator Bcl-2-like protein 14 [Ascaphus truei]|uniref:apoptosis facilitator Bcl-2-like protein 14 n=1 Tax=Ascaphus truei TaxID=8439 RepID=UPI003F5AA38A